MADPVQTKLKQSLESAEALYHRLVLLVGPAGSGKTAVLRGLAGEPGVRLVNVNLVLSAELLELTARQRILRLPRVLERVVGNDESVLLLDNLEILFDQHLQHDPLRLLQSLSRHRPVVAAWNGIIDHHRLIYAEAGHPEYRSYDVIDTLFVGMDGTATVDLDA